MEVDAPADVKNELPTPPASDVGSPTSFSHSGSDSEPDSPMGEDAKVCMIKTLSRIVSVTGKILSQPPLFFIRIKYVVTFCTLTNINMSLWSLYLAAECGHGRRIGSRRQCWRHVGPLPHGFVHLHPPLPLPKPPGRSALLIRQQLSWKHSSHCH